MNDSPIQRNTAREADAFRSLLSHTLHFALPGAVVSFDKETQTATIQPMIRERLRSGESLSIPPLGDVPVFFPGGRESALTYPVSPGDECLLIFSDACIDDWFMTGQESTPSSTRRHDLSDAFAFVGFRSRPHALKHFPDQPSFFGGNP